jgi:hypothetical protein
MDVELPAIAGLVGVLDHGDDVDAEPAADEGDRRRFALDLEILDRLGRVDLDQQRVDEIIDALKRFMVDIPTRNVEHHVDVHGVHGRLSQDRILGERSGFDDLGDLDLGLVPNVFAQLSDQSVDLGVVFLPLVGGQAQHVAVVVSNLSIAQRHLAPPYIAGVRQADAAPAHKPRGLQAGEISSP